MEVGYGMGISATFIQEQAKTCGVTEHVIIEANLGVYQRLLAFAEKWRGEGHVVTPMLGFWEEVSPSLPDGSFDAVLFDPYVLLAPTQAHQTGIPSTTLSKPIRAMHLSKKATVCSKREGY